MRSRVGMMMSMEGAGAGASSDQLTSPGSAPGLTVPRHPRRSSAARTTCHVSSLRRVASKWRSERPAGRTRGTCRNRALASLQAQIGVVLVGPASVGRISTHGKERLNSHERRPPNDVVAEQRMRSDRGALQQRRELVHARFVGEDDVVVRRSASQQLRHRIEATFGRRRRRHRGRATRPSFRSTCR